MRFCVFDFEFTNRDSMCINKLIFVSWAPETAKGKRKLIFASTKENFKKYLSGLVKDYQASTLEDLSFAEIKGYFDR
jgi:cofilin